MRTYVLSPASTQRIEDSWILTQYPEFQESFYGPNFYLDDIYQELLENPFSFPEFIRRKILSIVTKNNIDESNSLSLQWEWHIWTGKILKRKHLYKETQLDLFHNEPVPEFALYSNTHSIPVDCTDFALASWWYLPEDFSSDVLWDYEKYWFRSYLEFLMTLSAYRLKDILSMKDNEYQWINSKWIKNTITACVHGDLKLYQYDEWKKAVISPYYEQVWFYPRQCIGAMTNVYHHMEDLFFATFFRYVIDSWKEKEIFWEKWEKILKYIDTLPNRWWNFGDAGDTTWMEEFDFKIRLKQRLYRVNDKPNALNTHTFTWAPWLERESNWYEASINTDGDFELKSVLHEWEKVGSTVIKYSPEDCQHIIKWLLWQCAHGHWRTSVNTLKRLIEYYYSDIFDRDEDDF